LILFNYLIIQCGRIEGWFYPRSVINVTMASKNLGIFTHIEENRANCLVVMASRRNCSSGYCCCWLHTASIPHEYRTCAVAKRMYETQTMHAATTESPYCNLCWFICATACRVETYNGNPSISLYLLFMDIYIHISIYLYPVF